MRFMHSPDVGTAGLLRTGDEYGRGARYGSLWKEVSSLASDLSRSSAAYPRADDTDILVALIRASAIIAILVFPPETRGLLSAPPYMQQVLVIAILFLFAQAWLFFRGLPLHPHRPVALVVDTLLVLAITLTFAAHRRNLFEIYYLVVIAGALWYGRRGALSAAVVAIVLSYIVEYLTLAPDPLLLAAQLLITRVPLLLLVAIITSYLVRARDVEHALNIEVDHELRLARSLQAAMLPTRIPQLPGYRIQLRFEPARHVGGDLYRIQTLPDGRLLLVLVDMAGKSVYGLVHLSALNSHLDAALADGVPPAELATRVNRGIYQTLQPDSYAACFFAALDPATATIEFVNCGHVPPLLLHPGGTPTEELSTGGILIGAVEQPEYTALTRVLQPGDLLVLFTDGICEARNAHGEQLGPEGIEAALHIAREESEDIAHWADAVVAARHAFAAEEHADDATLVLLTRHDRDVAAPTGSA